MDLNFLKNRRIKSSNLQKTLSETQIGRVEMAWRGGERNKKCLQPEKYQMVTKNKNFVWKISTDPRIQQEDDQIALSYLLIVENRTKTMEYWVRFDISANAEVGDEKMESNSLITSRTNWTSFKKSVLWMFKKCLEESWKEDFQENLI